MATPGAGPSQPRPPYVKMAVKSSAPRTANTATLQQASILNSSTYTANPAIASKIATKTSPVAFSTPPAKTMRATKSTVAQPTKTNQRQILVKTYPVYERDFSAQRFARNEDDSLRKPRRITAASSRSAAGYRRNDEYTPIAIPKAETPYGLDWSKLSLDSEEPELSDTARSSHNFTAAKTVQRAARKSIRLPARSIVDVMQIDDSHSPLVVADVEPDEELVNALDSLTISTVKLQNTKRLPFLLRDLRRGFKSRCEHFRVPVSSSTSQYPTPAEVKILYTSSRATSFEGVMPGYFCPVCDLYHKFPTREMLDKHLEWDHKRYIVEWLTSGNSVPPQITITIPEDVDESESSGDEENEQDFLSEAAEDDELDLTDSASGASNPSKAPSPSPSPSLIATPSPPPIVLQPLSSPEPEKRPDVYIGDGAMFTASIVPTTQIPSTPTPEPEIQTRPPRPEGKNILGVEYPMPPPYGDLEGPACVDPTDLTTVILPEGTYSARPGGAKLYDLLNDLPLDDYGVMAWFVVDKEEAIYQQDDVRDEDKVMQALWTRYILVNRDDFIMNNAKGVQNFIDEYWRKIHDAAGFSALRIWLLTLASHRYLKVSDMGKLAKRYTDIVGMDLWVQT